jgi:hypothetical protein
LYFFFKLDLSKKSLSSSFSTSYLTDELQPPKTFKLFIHCYLLMAEAMITTPTTNDEVPEMFVGLPFYKLPPSTEYSQDAEDSEEIVDEPEDQMATQIDKDMEMDELSNKLRNSAKELTPKKPEYKRLKQMKSPPRSPLVVSMDICTSKELAKVNT